jgi:hypothetical protein
MTGSRKIQKLRLREGYVAGEYIAQAQYVS